jgi:hypothetical protein
MDFVRVQGMVMYALPFAPGVLLDAGAARTLAGRNVGQGTMLRAGVTTAFRL